MLRVWGSLGGGREGREGRGNENNERLKRKRGMGEMCQQLHLVKYNPAVDPTYPRKASVLVIRMSLKEGDMVEAALL
jgi:hypothetical protein